MSAERRTPPADPTSERTSDQSTQTTGGLTGGRDDASRDAADRRETDVGDSGRPDQDRASDPVLPADDSTLATKI
jgi:hypothetical protein